MEKNNDIILLSDPVLKQIEPMEMKITNPYKDMPDLIPTRKKGLIKPYKRESKKIGRNEPCPCGSGKKYKKCCL